MTDNPPVKFIRLKTGDDIICEVVTMEVNEEVWYTVINPLKVSYVQSELAGYLQIAFIPWVFPKLCDIQEFTIREDDVLIMNDVSEKLNTYYWENLHTYIGESKEPESDFDTPPEEEPHDGMSEEELEVYREMMEQLGTKRTFH